MSNNPVGGVTDQSLKSLRSNACSDGSVDLCRQAIHVCASSCFKAPKLIVRVCRYEHPFLLADNRHYTFYIWRRLFNVHPLSRYLLAPFYLASMTAMYSLAGEHHALLLHSIADAVITGLSDLWSAPSMLIWAFATAATLVPSPLLEFRYMLIPYILLRLHLRPSARWRASAELAMNVAINAVTLYVFLYKPFRWPTEPGWQRFMW